MRTRSDAEAGPMAQPGAQTREALSFGPFSLVVGERLLTRDGAPLCLGARALDLLIALVSRPNEAVAKRDLIARVWPDTTVDEGSLRFHVAGLRKARSEERRVGKECRSRWSP